MTWTINAAGVAIVKEFEGCVLTAYRDPAGVWTIGYGHTQDVTPGEIITQQQADQMLQEDLNWFGGLVSGRLPSSTTDNQYSAMVSLAYNIGTGAFSSSSVLRNHNAGELLTAATSFIMWDKAHINGQLTAVPGLLRRRFAEAGLYLTP